MADTLLQKYQLAQRPVSKNDLVVILYCENADGQEFVQELALPEGSTFRGYDLVRRGGEEE